MLLHRAAHYLLISIALIVTLLFTSGTQAVSPPGPHIAPILSVGGASEAVAAGGGYVYVADGWGIVVYDARGGGLVGIDRWLMAGPVHSLTLSGSLLAVGAGSQVALLTIDERGGFTLSGTYRADTEVKAVAITPGWLFVGTAGGLETVDISMLSAPARRGTLTRTYGINGLFVDGHTLYAISHAASDPPGTTYAAALKIDASNPAAPNLIGEVLLAGGFGSSAVGLTLLNGMLYIAGDLWGRLCSRCTNFQIWTVNPATFAKIGVKDFFNLASTSEDVTAFAASGSYLLVVTRAREMWVIDARNPDNLQAINRLMLSAFPGAVNALAQDATRVYVTLNGGVQLIDVAPPDPQAWTVGQISALTGSVFNTSLRGDSLLLFASNGLIGFNVQNPRAITSTGPIDPTIPPDQISGVRFGDGGIGAVYSHTGKTYLIDSRTDIIRYSSALPFDRPEAITSHGNIAYLASGPDLNVIDLTNLASPQVLSQISDISSTLALATEGDRLYRLSARNRLDLYSLASPTNPTILGGIDVPQTGGSLAVAGGLVYLSLADGAQIVDLRDPSAPGLGPTFGIGVGAGQVAITNGMLGMVGRDQSLPNSSTQSIFRVYQLNGVLAPTLLAERKNIGGYSPQISASAGRFAIAERGGGAVVYTLFDHQIHLPLLGR